MTQPKLIIKLNNEKEKKKDKLFVFLKHKEQTRISRIKKKKHISSWWVLCMSFIIFKNKIFFFNVIIDNSAILLWQYHQWFTQLNNLNPRLCLSLRKDYLAATFVETVSAIGQLLKEKNRNRRNFRRHTYCHFYSLFWFILEGVRDTLLLQMALPLTIMVWTAFKVLRHWSVSYHILSNCQILILLSLFFLWPTVVDKQWKGLLSQSNSQLTYYNSV